MVRCKRKGGGTVKILSFGEILWDVYPDKQHIGGAPLNFAAHLAKHGEDVSMLSALGKDTLGKEALQQLKAWGIDTTYVATLSDKPTGSCQVTLDANAVPTYNLLEDVAYDYIPCDTVTDTFDVLYFGTLALRSTYNLESLQKLLNKGRHRDVFVDVNIRPPFYTAQTVRFAAENATIIKISDEEMPTVASLLGLETAAVQDFVRVLAKKYPNLRCIIVTRGADGALAFDTAHNALYSCESERVQVVSTVGAGDSFSAAFLHKYLQGQGLDACLVYAAKVAGFVVSHVGAVPEYHKAAFG
ncbi:MAG: carbohydrate kinase [Ruminococcaceae bacterium]|nr:carbohydrate kinase [Oscillospiraceae bacterium]